MKKFISLSLLIITCIIIEACSKDNDSMNIPKESSPIENLKLIKKIINEDDYSLELYNKTGELYVGSNLIHVKITKNDEVIEVTDLDWNILMHMVMTNNEIQHGAPTLPLKKTKERGYYQGYLMPTMHSEDSSNYWTLRVTAKHQEKEIIFEDKINVFPGSKEIRSIQTFQTNSNKSYTIILINPTAYKVGINDISAVIFSTEDQEVYVLEDGYTIEIDPRMPDMDNHSSSKNVHLTQSKPGELYKGKLSLTMNGYWRINLKTISPKGEILKGEDITDTNNSSSIFFEINI